MMGILSKIKLIDVIFISAIGFLLFKSGVLKAQYNQTEEYQDNQAILDSVQNVLGYSNYTMLTTYLKPIWNYGTYYGIDPALVSAIIMAESSGNPKAKTWEPNANQYSWGLMQMLETTAKGLGFNGAMDIFLSDTDFAIYYGVMLLDQLNKRFPNDVIRMVAYYNAGKPEIYGTGTYINGAYISYVLQTQLVFRDAFKLMFNDYLTRFPDSIWVRI
jgi:soluble lytic murein transglycosylase-like protein